MPDARRWDLIWYEGAAPGLGLQALSHVFGAVVRLRRAAYARGWLRSRHVGRPVVVIGNLTVGGTGKTPLVIWLAQRLRVLGYSVGIMTRGYGGHVGSLRFVDENSSAIQVGDEALLLHRHARCPVVVGADRVAGGRALARRGCDVLLSDDGLQHLRLHRDFEIVVLDARRGLGNGRLLPAGPLREPGSRLAAADAVVNNVTATAGASDHAIAAGRLAAPAPLLLRMQLTGHAAFALASATAQAAPKPLEQFRGSAVHAIAGIGNPGRFYASLRAAGLTLVEHSFPDHHGFKAADIDFGDELPVLMTEKDAVKCARYADARHWYVPVVATLAPADEQALLARLTTLLSTSKHAGGY